MCTFDGRVTVVESTTAHNHLEKVFAVVTNQVCVVKSGTVFKLMAISWCNTGDDGIDDARFVDFAWLLLDHVHCYFAGMCDCTRIVRLFFIWAVRICVSSVSTSCA